MSKYIGENNTENTTKERLDEESILKEIIM